MKILITNDDGIKASGIIRLAEEAVKYGEVWVVAPESERSAASHSITLHSSIDVTKEDFPVPGVVAYAAGGMPADCVRVGVLNIVPGKPDIVLSGINNGINAGTDVQYSATVGAAMEAVFQGIPAVALSEQFGGGDESAKHFLPKILKEVINTEYVPGKILNVNFPKCSPGEVKGVLRDRKNAKSSVFNDLYDEENVGDIRRFTVRGIHIYEAEEGTDLRAVYDKYISIGWVTNLS